MDLRPLPVAMRTPVPPGSVDEEEGEQAARDRAWLREIFRHAGLPMEAYKAQSLHRRKAACMRALGANSSSQARLVLSQRPDRLSAALGALLIGVTGFFRDPPAFESLVGLVKSAAAHGPMHVWSAGCSSGAELYSVAMLLDDAGLLENARLLGTDCRPDAIAHASLGRYDMQAMPGIPEHFRQRYCRIEGNSFRITDRLRRAVRFTSGNVLEGVEPGRWDLILCRNLAIYLQLAVAEKLWTALEGALAGGGLLMLGKAERPTGTTRLRPAGTMIWRRNTGK